MGVSDEIFGVCDHCGGRFAYPRCDLERESWCPHCRHPIILRDTKKLGWWITAFKASIALVALALLWFSFFSDPEPTKEGISQTASTGEGAEIGRDLQRFLVNLESSPEVFKELVAGAKNLQLQEVLSATASERLRAAYLAYCATDTNEQERFCLRVSDGLNTDRCRCVLEFYLEGQVLSVNTQLSEGNEKLSTAEEQSLTRFSTGMLAKGIKLSEFAAIAGQLLGKDRRFETYDAEIMRAVSAYDPSYKMSVGDRKHIKGIARALSGAQVRHSKGLAGELLWAVGMLISSILGTILLLVAVFATLAAYLAPTIWACRAQRRNIIAILLLNLLLGWTFVGWVVALVWAACEDT